MLKLSLRTFSGKAAKLQSSHSYSFYKSKSPTGLPRCSSHRLYDPFKLGKLQELLKSYSVAPSLSLTDSVHKLASTDPEFSEFLSEFSATPPPPPPSEDSLRLNELHAHEQFRKKRFLGEFHKENESGLKAKGADPCTEALERSGIKVSELIDSDSFRIMMLDASSTTNITKLARVNSRRCLLFMGNLDGIIAYGKGKGSDYRNAYNKAIESCKRNLIAIPLDLYNTNPKLLEGRYNNVKLQIIPAPSGSSWGDPRVHNMITLAGMTRCRFKIIGRNRNIYSVVYALFNALTQNTTLRMHAEETGCKPYSLLYGRPTHCDSLTSGVPISY